MQSTSDIRGNFSVLSRDLLHIISPYLSNKDICSVMRTGKEASEISRKYFRPTQEDFLLAIIKGNILVVRNLLGYSQIDPSANNNYAIRQASANGHTEIVRILLEDSRIDPAAKNNYAIRWASLKGYTNVVRLLLQDERVDPSADNNFAFHSAIQNDHTDVVKILLQDPRVKLDVWDYHVYSLNN